MLDELGPKFGSHLFFGVVINFSVPSGEIGDDAPPFGIVVEMNALLGLNLFEK